ncbi:MAG: hypothetical protein LBR22_09820 [Desulfovibrio sp.]|nr:hypothetical protein [Desulfovibrio sp.]
MKFPDDCIQQLFPQWWVKLQLKKRKRWQLAWAYARHVASHPYEVIIDRRSAPKTHDSINLSVTVFRKDRRDELKPIPVASIPTYTNEILTINRGKVRPVLIVATPGTTIPHEIRKNLPEWYSAATYIVVPYFTAMGPEFIKRIKLCEYTQCFWDLLPFEEEGHGSILRFDHIQAVEPEINSLIATEWSLSDNAQEILNDALLRHFSQVDFSPTCLAAQAISKLKEEIKDFHQTANTQ